MKTRYYIKVKTLGGKDETFVTSDDESKVKKIWHNLFKRWLDRGVLDFTDHRFTFRVNGFVKECTHGSYSFVGEDPHKDSITL